MAVKVTFVNNDEIIIYDDTYILAWKSDDISDDDPCYYATGVLAGSWEEGTTLGTSEQVVALQGLFGSVDWFSLKDEPKKIYKTSAILSLTFY
ncbi:hypothetical protein [Leuconostoc citreum]|uniref:hypothetical protein n=1 Tax=Leuconostoc citreum TaxID=33964 RepID=UPI000513506C|nr:hypothetical protein [Leuconostoc citreum]KAF0260907.1 hypothetical protein CRI81_01645 [Leuconostoc citreum]MBE4725049.1 hypothetical protein [Leuconostoc citreum]MCT3069595.1 hypothetical protein [Leuconostoc citreum]QEA55558.1 hypothetical protein FGL76_05685 [Leuconostoc citreum]CDX65153.1 Prophage pi2 protein 08 [Leuconostoc citreum]